MGRFVKGNQVNLGRKMPEHVKQALLKACKGRIPWNKGKPWSSEVKAKMSKAKIGKPSNALGLKHSSESRKKMSESAKGKHVGNKGSGWKDGRSLIPGYRSWTSNRRNRVILRMKKEGRTHSFADWMMMKKQFGFTCLCCRKQEPEIKLTIDHIIPLSKGGDDSIENIQPLCLRCNLKKHTMATSFKDVSNVGNEEASTRNFCATKS